jgi:hypothetical protein
MKLKVKKIPVGGRRTRLEKGNINLEESRVPVSEMEPGWRREIIRLGVRKVPVGEIRTRLKKEITSWRKVRLLLER